MLRARWQKCTAALATATSASAAFWAATALALMDALVSTTHDLSLARALRSPVLGWSDADLADLAKDIGRLYLEKDRSKPSIFREYIPILPVLALVPLIVLVGMWFLNRTRKQVERLG